LPFFRKKRWPWPLHQLMHTSINSKQSRGLLISLLYHWSPEAENEVTSSFAALCTMIVDLNSELNGNLLLQWLYDCSASEYTLAHIAAFWTDLYCAGLVYKLGQCFFSSWRQHQNFNNDWACIVGISLLVRIGPLDRRPWPVQKLLCCHRSSFNTWSDRRPHYFVCRLLHVFTFLKVIMHFHPFQG
jgi:hypothetical protein